MLDRVRWRLALGYVIIFAMILLLLLTAAVVGFSRELTLQQDILLTQEARNQSRNLLNGKHRAGLATGLDEFGWIRLAPDGGLVDSDRAAGPLDLPAL